MAGKVMKAFITLHITAPMEIEIQQNEDNSANFFLKTPAAQTEVSLFIPDESFMDEHAELRCSIKDQAIIAALESALRHYQHHFDEAHDTEQVYEGPVRVRKEDMQ